MGYQMGSRLPDVLAGRRPLAPLGAFASGLGRNHLSSMMVGPTAVIWASLDPVQPAKLITEFAKQKESFLVKGGVMDGSALSIEQVEALAKLPSRNELLGNLLSLINAPGIRLLQMMNAPASSLVRLLEAWRAEIEKKNQ